MKRQYAIGLVMFFSALFIAMLFMLNSQSALAQQACTTVAGSVDIKFDNRTPHNEYHLLAEFRPANALQNGFTGTRANGVTTTIEIEYLGCLTTEDVCYGAFEIPTDTVEFVTGVQTVTTSMKKLRVEGCSVKIVPIETRRDGYLPTKGTVTLFKNGVGNPQLQITAYGNGALDAFILDGDHAEYVTDVLDKNSEVITTPVGVYLYIKFPGFKPPTWPLTDTRGVLSQFEGLRYKVGEIVEVQPQKGEWLNLSRYAGRSLGMMWPMEIIDPNKCPEFVWTKVESMTVFGEVIGVVTRPDIIRTTINNQDGTSEGVNEGVYTHTFALPGSYNPILYGYNQGHEEVCKVVTKNTIVVPAPVTPTPIPTPVPPGRVVITSSSPTDFYLEFHGVLPPKQEILVNTSTGITHVSLVGNLLKLPSNWESFNLGIAGIAINVRTGFALTDGINVFRTAETLMLANIQNLK